MIINRPIQSIVNDHIGDVLSLIATKYINNKVNYEEVMAENPDALAADIIYEMSTYVERSSWPDIGSEIYDIVYDKGRFENVKKAIVALADIIDRP